MEQLGELGQTRAIVDAIMSLGCRRFVVGQGTLKEALDALEAEMDQPQVSTADAFECRQRVNDQAHTNPPLPSP